MATSKKLFDFSTFDKQRSVSRVISPRVWSQVNGVALFIGTVTYYLWITFGDLNNIICWKNALILYLIGSLKGYTYIFGLYFAFRNRRKYFTETHRKMEEDRSWYGHVFWCCVRSSFSAIFLEIFNTMGAFYFFGVDDASIWYKYPIIALILFILKFFCWEIWFDFGHYWGHRVAHMFKPLYEFGHIVHHESISTDAFDGLNISFDDALLTNFIPHMLSMFITTKIFGFNPFCTAEYHIMGSYKTFVEITGHVGVDFRGRSFPIFPLLPYYLGIDIGTSAYHSVHHVYNKFNFSKRFTLWDRMFNTMLIPPTMKTGSKKETLNAYKPIFKGKKASFGYK